MGSGGHVHTRLHVTVISHDKLPQGFTEPRLFEIGLESFNLLTLSHFPEIVNYVLGGGWVDIEQVEAWSPYTERWSMQNVREPIAIAPWLSMILIRQPGGVRNRGAGRRIMQLQREQLGRWMLDAPDIYSGGESD